MKKMSRRMTTKRILDNLPGGVLVYKADRDNEQILYASKEIITLFETARNVEFVSPAYRFNLIKADPDDNKFVDCAVTAGATYIVSNDKHFSELSNYDFPKVDVRTLSQFLEIVRSL